MNIGILTYFDICNFGANLQALSTYNYFLNRGYHPIMINWMTESLEKKYKTSVPALQYESHFKFCRDHFKMTNVCRTSKDVAEAIKHFNIAAVVVGSDAVAQHHTFFSRIIFPSSRIVSFVPSKEDTTCPNPFWGTFNQYLETSIPIVMMSVSNQDTNYKIMRPSERKIMKECAQKMKFISARDMRTSAMFSYVTGGEIKPTITPDPVFAFNYNVDQQPSEQDIRSRYDIRGKYILVCLQKTRNISNEWIQKFKEICLLKGYQPIAFPLPGGISFEHTFEKVIDVPLDPMDWYSLIKYSSGYVGCNMHPIVVSLHNGVPCFSFDNYGVAHFRMFIEKKSSKIYHILNEFGVLCNRVRSRGIFQRTPSPEDVFNKLEQFDRGRVLDFSKKYIDRYKQMMENIEAVLIHS
ncbi:MAG: polysaccharide pyruvyl transferase family protein [Bacteroides sp.]|nr:polysaccharide pyruvyl transferase family protein [Bacteroides sp.]